MSETFRYFSFMTSSAFSGWEKGALWSVLGVAVLGLLYAVFLVNQVLRESRGTDKMISIAKAIESGANAYLVQQFKAIVFLIMLLAGVLYFTAGEQHIAVGRACAGSSSNEPAWLVSASQPGCSSYTGSTCDHRSMLDGGVS